MSRFPELFEVIEHVVLEEAFLVEELAAHIAGEIVERQAPAGRRRGSPPVPGRAPHARDRPRDPGDARSDRDRGSLGAGCPAGGRRRGRGINACPCAQGLVRERRLTACSRRASRGRRRADPAARPARDAQPARGRDAVRRQRGAGERGAARRDRRVVDERARSSSSSSARTSSSSSSTRTFSRASSRTPSGWRSRECWTYPALEDGTSSSRARSTWRRSTDGRRGRRTAAGERCERAHEARLAAASRPRRPPEPPRWLAKAARLSRAASVSEAAPGTWRPSRSQSSSPGWRRRRRCRTRGRSGSRGSTRARRRRGRRAASRSRSDTSSACRRCS